MTCDQLADRLADYLEGDLDATTQAAVETHASSCDECGLLLTDLRQLQADATKLPELSPTRDLWAGIAARIETPVVELKNGGTVERWSGGTQRRRSSLWIGVAAAGLVAVTATVTHELTKRSIAPSLTTASVQRKPDTITGSGPATRVANVDTVPRLHRSTVPPAGSTVPPSSTTRLASSKPSAEQTYEVEITRLRAVLNQRRPQLDSSTVAVVEHNLQVIDDAIRQCKQALRKDPASRFLIESLNDALDTKVQLLRTAATLPSTT
ncbi:MAG TPA: zf-HC2 domain-containing protein [Gemmatimonadaceae bacterium]|nr:zf-HC2 domain-containing protein [Gemmatimonadaceae bacterium]